MKKICLVLLVLAASSARAQIVLPIPGEGGNTVRSMDGGTDWLGAGETETTWRNRGLEEVGGDGFMGISGYLPYSVYANSSTSVAPELRTTIGGLHPYQEIEVWVLFSTCCYNDGTIRKNNWVAAGIDDGSALTEYSIQAGNAVRTGLVSRIELSLYYEVAAGYMGTVTADGSGRISLLADSTLGYSGDGIMLGDRTIFHGYAITPEPAALLLFALGGLVLRFKRT